MMTWLMDTPANSSQQETNKCLKIDWFKKMREVGKSWHNVGTHYWWRRKKTVNNLDARIICKKFWDIQ